MDLWTAFHYKCYNNSNEKQMYQSMMRHVLI